MIKSYRNAKTRKVHQTGNPKGFRGLNGKRAALLLDVLDAAEAIDQLPRLAAFRLHKLSRDRKGQWSMTINLPWVVCFTPLKGGGWVEVEIVDYH